ncbi:hypothetical protein GCM10008018_64540 [Paenibacillus marchantiophytorum]|uniref:MBL fold metallo-hydrolase n=1 Tax=Paenibacillus marchantiophytorum TaxID=1619310 RepID=A0ABQ1FFX9_9BACL|nr:hypothetical protein GCM10008018_64540 [Paenibacillus marchantiophytorum]
MHDAQAQPGPAQPSQAQPSPAQPSPAQPGHARSLLVTPGHTRGNWLFKHKMSAEIGLFVRKMTQMYLYGKRNNAL